MTDSEFVTGLLDNIYRRQFIYLKSVNDFSPTSMSIGGHFCVKDDAVSPKCYDYMCTYVNYRMPYVPAEYLMRCINQLGFGLVGLQVRSRRKPFRGIGIKRYRVSLRSFLITKYQSSHHRLIPREKEFEISAQITRTRLSSRGLCIAQMEFKGAVEGKVTFGWKMQEADQDLSFGQVREDAK